jgi:hypothetical protein
MNFAGIAQGERLASSRKVQRSIPAPRSTSNALLEEAAREYLFAMVMVLVAAVIGFVACGGLQ